jgi:tRNA U34 5-methylaminomethyl-2-thiouridine-forming methyltransferase MnmC
MDFKGRLGNYKIIETEDNTQTVYSEFFEEACHNISGAWEETLHNYIQGCELSDIIQKKSLHVLDVGFGIGIGLKAMIDFLTKYPETINHSYTSIELDEELVHWALKNTLQEIKLDLFPGHFKGQWKNLEIIIYIGDGRKTLVSNRQLLPAFNAIFQDAFSPKKNPALWSVEWFTFLREVSDQEVVMSTYSSSISVRKSMVKAGWTVLNALGFKNKRTMTKARLYGTTEHSLLDRLNKSPILEIVDN